MRSLEGLIREYPNKTGKEILEIQKQEEKEDQDRINKRFKTLIDTIKDYNENGGYYRGKFGNDQYYYYYFHDFTFYGDGKYSGNVDTIILFTTDSIGNFSVKRETEKFVHDLSTYGLSHEERVTKKEWDDILNHLDNIHKMFW